MSKLCRIHDVDRAYCPKCHKRMRLDKEMIICYGDEGTIQRDWFCYKCGIHFEQNREYEQGIVITDILLERD